jgi:CheY-like chemotaxis protein
MLFGPSGKSGEPSEVDADHVLLVDTDLPMLESLREELEADGFAVSIAGNGLDAICRLAEMPRLPVAILTGLEMPWMSGHELCAFVRSDPSLKSVVLMVIADLDSTDLDAFVVGRPANCDLCRRLIRQLRDTVPPAPPPSMSTRGRGTAEQA